MSVRCSLSCPTAHLAMACACPCKPSMPRCRCPFSLSRVGREGSRGTPYGTAGYSGYARGWRSGGRCLAVASSSSLCTAPLRVRACVRAVCGRLQGRAPQYSVVLCWVLVGSASVYPLTHGSDYADERSGAPAPPPPPRPTGTAARAFVWRAHDGARTRCEGGRASQPWAGRASRAAEDSSSAGLRCSCVFAGQPLLAAHDAHFAPISVGAPQHVAPQAHEADYDMVPASPVSSPPASHHRMSRGRARQPEPARGARSARPAATLPLSSPAHAYRRRCVVHAPRHGRIRALCS